MEVSRKTTLWLIKGILALAALFYLIKGLHWKLLYASLLAIRPFWALMALGLVGVNLGLEAYKWHRMLLHVAPNTRYREALGAMLSGYALGFFTPARLGDYAGRVLFLTYPRKGEIAALTFAERMLNLTCYLGIGLIALTYFLLTTLELPPFTWYTVLSVSAFGFIALLTLILHPRLAHTVLSTLIPIKQIQNWLTFLNRFNTRDAHYLLALSALRYAVFSTQFFLLILAFQENAPVFESYTGIFLVFFAKSAIPSFTMMDLGIREGASVFFLGQLGISEVAAFNAAFLLFCINILLPAGIGIPFLFKLHLEILRKPIATIKRSADA